MPMSGITKNRTRTSFFHAGFTLLEVTVALSIVAIVLLSVYRLHSQTILMGARSRFDSLAPLLAKQKLSETEIDLSRAGTGSGDFGDHFPGYDWKVTVSEVSSEHLGQVSKGFKRIDVQIRYENGNMTYQFRAYRLTGTN